MVHGPARLLVVALAAAVLVVLPTVQVGEAAPRADVQGQLVSLPGDERPVRLEVDRVVALSADVSDGPVEVRWETAHGWSDWVELEAAGDHQPDGDSAELATVRPGMSDPTWTGAVDVIELRAAEPGDVRVEVVTMSGGLDYRADATPPSTAEAFGVWPPIVPRTAWDPNGDCEPRRDADVAPVAERIFVHHTVIFPDYPPEAGDDVVRAVCLGHVNHRGFSDVGYNFLIDRYGVIYQGREGGILKAVEGAHAQGFNTGSVGIALVGDFQEDGVPAEAARSLDKLVTWLAHLHEIDPVGRGLATSTGGDSTRFPEGFIVDLPNIVGHRDTGRNTACPGDHLFDIVRGRRPMGPRVHDQLVHHYGWPRVHQQVRLPATTAPPTSTPPLRATPDPVRTTAAEVVRGVVDGVDQRDVVTLVTRVLSARGAGSTIGN